LCFEGNYRHAAAPAVLLTGFFTAYTRYLSIFAVSMYVLDLYQLGNFTPELWSSARYSYPTGIDFDVSHPYTLMYHKALVSIPIAAEDDTAVWSADGKTPITYS
jgi:hypothetical protein